MIVVMSLISTKGTITPKPRAKQVRDLASMRRAKLLLKYMMVNPKIFITLVAIRVGFRPKYSAAG